MNFTIGKTMIIHPRHECTILENKGYEVSIRERINAKQQNNTLKLQRNSAFIAVRNQNVTLRPSTQYDYFRSSKLLYNSITRSLNYLFI